jgi:hypothetical protein
MGPRKKNGCHHHKHTHTCLAGTSIWEMQNRATKTTAAAQARGMKGTAINSMFDGRWETTMVNMAPYLPHKAATNIKTTTSPCNCQWVWVPNPSTSTITTTAEW